MITRRTLGALVASLPVISTDALAQCAAPEETMKPRNGRTIEQYLEANGWQFVDNSGDGGPFGYHAKVILDGKYVITMSAGGEGWKNDFLYPVHLYDLAAREFPDSTMLMGTDVAVGLYKQEAPPTNDDIQESNIIANGVDWEVLLPDVGAAVGLANWLESNLKS
jgi:hypothetical protein